MSLDALFVFGVPLIWVLVPLLACVIVCDLRWMRIPHVLIALIGVLFVLSVPFAVPLSDLLWRFAAAGIVFALSFAAFAARLLGGGDVKLLPLIILFVPAQDLPLFALFLSGGLILGLMSVRALRASAVAQSEGWIGITKSDRYPLGPGIGLAGIGYALFGAQVAALF